jgi:hypothetical protein
MMVYLVVLIEALAVIGAILLARRWRRFGVSGRIVCGLLLGMTAFAFLHGFCFGILQAEGPHGRDDPLLLAGFGVVAAIMPGTIVGAILGLILCRLRPRRA